MITYVSDESQPAWKGYLYAVLIFFLAEIRSILLHQYFDTCFRVGMRIRSGIIAAVYKKVPSFLSLSHTSYLFLSLTQALALSNKARRTKTVGEIVNLMSVDAQRFMDLTNYLHVIWSGPFQIVLSMILLYATLGPSVFAGLAVLILLIPLNAVVSAIRRYFHAKMMSKKDIRIKMVNEVLNGIKVLYYIMCLLYLLHFVGYQIVCLGNPF